MSRSGWPVREYAWGVVEPMARAHSDLLALTRMLFELSPQKLKAATEERFTKYRTVRASLWGRSVQSLRYVLSFPVKSESCTHSFQTLIAFDVRPLAKIVGRHRLSKSQTRSWSALTAIGSVKQARNSESAGPLPDCAV